MRRILLIAVLALGTVTARAESPADELVRLRKENAALKAEVARLKEELAAAKPPAPKATAYAADAIVKLIPKEQLPTGGEMPDAKRQKAKKVLEANLGGEWMRYEVLVRDVTDATNTNGQAYWLMPQPVISGPFSVQVEARFSGSPPAGNKLIGRTVSVVGKVATVTILQADNGVILNIKLSDCQLAK